MGKVTLFQRKHVLAGFILFVLFTGFSVSQLYGDYSKNDFDALNLIEKARDLRKNQKLDEALSKLSDAVKLTGDNELNSLANLETAYVKFLQGENAIVYRMYIKKALQLNPTLTPQGFYDREFKKEFENITNAAESEKKDQMQNEIETAKKDVEKWDKTLNDRKNWAERSEKAEKQAEKELYLAKERLKTKENQLQTLEQKQLTPPKEKEEIVETTEPPAPGELKTYERKSLFIFPILYSKATGANALSAKRQWFLKEQMEKMFAEDFGRIDAYDVKAKKSIDVFLKDAHAFMENNSKEITGRRKTVDGKLQEALVDSKDIRKTVENSFAIVPFIDSVEKEVVKGEKSTDYVYNMYIHFDVYETSTKQKLKTLKINNKKNVLGVLSSVTGSFQVDNSDLEGLPEGVRKDEESFRNAIAGLLAVLKKKVKEMEQFRISAVLTTLTGTRFGFGMGHDTGIKIDQRYKAFVTKDDGSRKMTAFGKIRKVEASASEAQILIGRPEEGDQVEEDPKVGINVSGGFGLVPLKITLDGYVIASGLNPCLSLGAEYELGPILKISELYATLNLRIGLPGTEEEFANDMSISQVFYALGVTKKFYWRRLALNVGGEFGAHAATITSTSYRYFFDEAKASGMGFSIHAGAEILISPSISAYGRLNLDMYPTPTTYEEDGYELTMSTSDEWNAAGISMNLGIKVAL